MKLSVKAFAITAALVWGGAILITGIFYLIVPPYGEHFLLTISSVYPGFHVSGSLLDVLAGTGYGLIDGGVCGCLFAWLYNLFAGRMGQTA